MRHGKPFSGTFDGIISVILENTYTPTLTVRYTPKQEETK